MQGYGESTVKIKDEYNSVMAYSVPENREGSSDYGYVEGNAIVFWETPGGITGVSWYTENANSPFSGYDKSTIIQDAEKDKNLDKYFVEWGGKTDIDRGDFVQNTILDQCWDLNI